MIEILLIEGKNASANTLSVKDILNICVMPLLCIILTITVNYIIHKSSFKNDYHKIIIEKRLYSLELLNSLVSYLNIKVFVDESIILRPFLNENYYMELLKTLVKTIDNNFWLNKETSEKLTEFNVFLYKIVGSHNGNIDTKCYNKICVDNMDEIIKYRKELQYLVKKELINLHKVDVFFKKQ